MSTTSSKRCLQDCVHGATPTCSKLRLKIEKKHFAGGTGSLCYKARCTTNNCFFLCNTPGEHIYVFKEYDGRVHDRIQGYHLRELNAYSMLNQGLNSPMTPRIITNGGINESCINPLTYQVTPRVFAMSEKGIVLEFGNPLKTERELIPSAWYNLAALHTKRLLHRDIKPTNIIVINNTSRFIDFDRARIQSRLPTQCWKNFILSEIPLHTAVCCTYLYCCPYYLNKVANNELFDLVDFEDRLDVWSLATTWLELILGYIPFASQIKIVKKEARNDQTMTRNIHDRIMKVFGVDGKFSNDKKAREIRGVLASNAILRACFHLDPTQRPTSTQVIEALTGKVMSKLLWPISLCRKTNYKDRIYLLKVLSNMCHEEEVDLEIILLTTSLYNSLSEDQKENVTQTKKLLLGAFLLMSWFFGCYLSPAHIARSFLIYDKILPEVTGPQIRRASKQILDRCQFRLFYPHGLEHSLNCAMQPKRLKSLLLQYFNGELNYRQCLVVNHKKEIDSHIIGMSEISLENSDKGIYKRIGVPSHARFFCFRKDCSETGNPVEFWFIRKEANVDFNLDRVITRLEQDLQMSINQIYDLFEQQEEEICF